MPVPTVSPAIWERTRTLSYLLMATPQLDRDEFSFSVHVEQLCGSDFREMADDAKDKVHTEWGKGHTERLRRPQRSRPHRPEIGDDLDERLTESVKENYPTVPAAELPFERRLELLADVVEKYLNELGVTLKWKPRL